MCCYDVYFCVGLFDGIPLSRTTSDFEVWIRVSLNHYDLLQYNQSPRDTCNLEFFTCRFLILEKIIMIDDDLYVFVVSFLVN